MTTQRNETYTHGHAPATVRHHARRTVEDSAAFLLPHLRPGMRVIDVGCGPGSITRGLADRVAPGEVVGVDASAEVLDVARHEASTATNLRYQQSSVYQLPFADASFDVAFAHQVLQHLADPAAAIREMLRVLVPAGLVAVRDVDWGSIAYWPVDPWIDRFIDVHARTWTRNGGEPRMGRRLRALFNAAAVADVEINSSVWAYATAEQTRQWGESYAERLLTSPMGARTVEYGFASQHDLEQMAGALRAWAVHPDAYWSFVHVDALARKPSHGGKVRL